MPEDLYYSDQIEQGQVYSWYRYNQYYNETDLHNAGIGTNLTLEVIQDPHGIDARAMAEGDYFKSYVNDSYKSYNPISRFNSELIDPNTLLQPVIVNETQNYFEVLDEQQFQGFNTSINEGIINVDYEYEYHSNNMNYSIEMYLMFDIKLGIQLKSGYLYEEANFRSGFSYYLIQPSIDQYLPDDIVSDRSSSRFSDEAPLIYSNVIVPIGLISLIILKTRKFYR